MAQHNLGWANRMGRGCNVNYKEAMKLFMELNDQVPIFILRICMKMV